jgi:hypothetical protein
LVERIIGNGEAVGSTPAVGTMFKSGEIVMPGVNHRRKNKAQVDRRHAPCEYHSGYARAEDQNAAKRVGRTGFLDKSMHGSVRKSTLADRYVCAGIGNDFSSGHRGMAKAVRGAKKFIRSRMRFHENRTTQKLAEESLL